MLINFKTHVNYKTVSGLWKYDYGQRLEISGLDITTPTVEVDFSLSPTCGNSLPRIGTVADGIVTVPVPDSLLEHDAHGDYTIYAFVYVRTAEEGRTTHRITLSVKDRPKPEPDNIPESVFAQVLDQINTALAEMRELASSGGSGTSAPGTSGREVELQKSDTHIQWRYVGDSEWQNLIALEELKGSTGAQGPEGPQGPAGTVSQEAVTDAVVAYFNVHPIPNLDGYATEAWVSQQGYLTEHQDISGKADKVELHSHNNKSVLDTITADKINQITTNQNEISQLKQDITGKSDTNHTHDTYVQKTGHQANKYLGTDASGNIVEKEAPVGGNSGVVSAEDIQNAVNDYFTENPIPINEGLKMSQVEILGELIRKPNEDQGYVGWPFYCVQYDKSTNEIVFMINSGYVHGENENYDLYIGRMNPRTFEVTVNPFLDHITEGHGCYSCGFLIDENNVYRVALADAAKIYTSTDGGLNWTSVPVPFPFPFGLQKLSNGNFICFSNETGEVYYSADCENWTKSTNSITGKYERCIIELPDGNLISLGRKSWQATDTGAWNGNKIVEPAMFQVSHDFGVTWEKAKESVSIPDMTACNACGFYHEDEGLVELFVTSRYPHADSKGILLQYIATVEDALNDNFGEPKVVLYPNMVDGKDFGYIGGCKDSEGYMHIMYYDSDREIETGSTNYFYLKASRENNIVIPQSARFSSAFIPYSGKTVDALLSKLRTEMIAKINEMVISNGGTVEDASFYVTDGLMYNINLTDTEKFDFEAKTILGLNGETVYYDKAFSSDDIPVLYDTDTKTFAYKTKIYVPANEALEKFGADCKEFTLECVINSTVATPVGASRTVWETDTYNYNGTYLSSIAINAFYKATDGTEKLGSNVFQSEWVYKGNAPGNLFNEIGYKTLAVSYKSDGTIDIFKNGEKVYTYAAPEDFASWHPRISRGIKFFVNEEQNPVWLRYYNRALTVEEEAQNADYNKRYFD